MTYSSKEKRKDANKRYKATPEGRAKIYAATKRWQLRKRIEDMENCISKEGIALYIQSVRDKIEHVKEKLKGMEVTV